MDPLGGAQVELAAHGAHGLTVLRGAEALAQRNPASASTSDARPEPHPTAIARCPARPPSASSIARVVASEPGACRSVPVCRDQNVSGTELPSYAAIMICPKCQRPLRTVNRQGLSIEQCERCRGIFLDHGELERILDSEQHYYSGHRGRHDPARVERWKREEYPAIKARAAAEGATIRFADEASVRTSRTGSASSCWPRDCR